MLKALELVGFKSFADRTRFEFPEGITVVVGPNGSGKSNIVDAIKWVLGAQSAKSLRGADMADVIFKGSAAGGRKPSNSAEATLVFDNTKQQLPVDSPEVHVTRRVYRSGESEYLINNSACRLKDVKDLFRGTGVGVDAYSLIEQGKVDRMLQASPKDRRAIFEEAAGISRFKAKKVEAERRLARVDQNLLRLSDIVDEVKARYDTLQNQAEKARRYREMNQRLSLLRTQLGLAEIDSFRKSQLELRNKSASLSDQLAQTQEQFDQAKEEHVAIELRLQSIAEKALLHQGKQQEIRHKIASSEARKLHEGKRSLELEEEKAILQTRLRALRERAVISVDDVSKRQNELHRFENEHRDSSEQLRRLEAAFEESESRWRTCQQLVESRRDAYMQLLQASGLHTSKIASDKKHLTQLEASLSSKTAQLQMLESQIAEMDREMEAAQTNTAVLLQNVAEKGAIWQSGQAKLRELRDALAEQQEEALALQGRIQGLHERLNVLQELELQREGVGRGAQQLIQLAQQSKASPWDSVCGLVADLIEIDIHLAPLVDVALESAAETVVLADGRIIELLREGKLLLDGRVSMIRLDRLPSRKSSEKIQLDGLRGVIGRADRLVRCADPFAPLVRSLLGTTWLVDSLATALDLSQLRGAGLQFVTASCERIDSDGTLTIGALKSALGLVARKSELHAAKEEMEHFEKSLLESSLEVEQLQQAVNELEARLRFQDDEVRKLTSEATSAQLRWDSLKQQRNDCDENRVAIESELAELRRTCELASEEIQRAIETTGQLELQTSQAKESSENELAHLKSIEVEKARQQQEITSQRIVIAKIEQRLESHRVVLEQLAKDRDERQTAVEEAIHQIDSIGFRQQQLQLHVLDASSQLAMDYLDLDQHGEQLRVWALESREVQVALHQAQKRVEQLQRQLDKIKDRKAQLDVERSHIETSMTQLLQRFLEDYQLDLTEPALIESTPPMEDRVGTENEALKLKQEISQVGSVNMESLQELDELQKRYESLASHFQDLTEARDNLHKIIAKINQDSRRLFLETLEAIRTNFQLLYRKSFGGGHADILLEEGEDVLECGVEIVATPPGKTSLSNSLLSGGEKALTAVALIMAIFQFRPSPFCVLDEVDAPFDEANIGRFVTVLKEFLDWTKFIVVTHSKKTMTAANTLYGVTMQESGVSTQVSVRFEDVEEDGTIRSPSDEPRIHRAA